MHDDITYIGIVDIIMVDTWQIRPLLITLKIAFS